MHLEGLPCCASLLKGNEYGHILIRFNTFLCSRLDSALFILAQQCPYILAYICSICSIGVLQPNSCGFAVHPFRQILQWQHQWHCCNGIAYAACGIASMQSYDIHTSAIACRESPLAS